MVGAIGGTTAVPWLALTCRASLHGLGNNGEVNRSSAVLPSACRDLDGHDDTMLDLAAADLGLRADLGGLAHIALVKANQPMAQACAPDLWRRPASLARTTAL